MLSAAIIHSLSRPRKSISLVKTGSIHSRQQRPEPRKHTKQEPRNSCCFFVLCACVFVVDSFFIEHEETLWKDLRPRRGIRCVKQLIPIFLRNLRFLIVCLTLLLSSFSVVCYSTKVLASVSAPRNENALTGVFALSVSTTSPAAIESECPLTLPRATFPALPDWQAV